MFRISLMLALFAPTFAMADAESAISFGGDYFTAGNTVETA